MCFYWLLNELQKELSKMKMCLKNIQVNSSSGSSQNNPEQVKFELMQNEIGQLSDELNKAKMDNMSYSKALQIFEMVCEDFDIPGIQEVCENFKIQLPSAYDSVCKNWNVASAGLDPYEMESWDMQPDHQNPRASCGPSPACPMIVEVDSNASSPQQSSAPFNYQKNNSNNFSFEDDMFRRRGTDSDFSSSAASASPSPSPPRRGFGNGMLPLAALDFSDCDNHIECGRPMSA